MSPQPIPTGLLLGVLAACLVASVTRAIWGPTLPATAGGLAVCLALGYGLGRSGL